MDGLSSFFLQRNVKGVWPARMARHLPCPAAPHSPAQAARREGSTVERALPLHGQSPALPLPPGRNGWRFVSGSGHLVCIDKRACPPYNHAITDDLLN